MAIVYALTAGDWNTPTIWSTGAVPGNDDTVYANGKVVTISTTTNTVNQISNLAASGILTGGVFNFSGANGVLNTNYVNPVGANSAAGSGVNGVLSIAAGATGTFNGNISSAGNGTLANFISNNGGTLILNGNYNLLNNVANVANQILYITGGTTTINGNITSGQTTASTVNRNTIIVSNGTVNVNGYITSSGVSAGLSRTVYITGALSFNVNYTGTSNSGNAISAASSNTIYNLTGSTTFNIIGNVATTSVYPAIYIAPASAINITGNLIASASCSAVTTNSASAVLYVTGNIINNNTQNAYTGFRSVFLNSSTKLTIVTAANETKDYIKAGGASSDLTVNNVRNGVVYGSYTGTMVVPLPANVRVNTPIDATVGTLYMTPFLFWDTLTSTMTTGSSYGERLKVASTVTTDGSQITAYNI